VASCFGSNPSCRSIPQSSLGLVILRGPLTLTKHSNHHSESRPNIWRQGTRAERFLLLTECSWGDKISDAYPEKEMLRLCGGRCLHRAQLTLDDILNALLNHQYDAELPKNIRYRTRQAGERMIAIPIT